MPWLRAGGKPVSTFRDHAAASAGLFYQCPRLTGDIERKRRDHNAACSEADQIDGAGIFRGAGIVSLDRAVADLGGAVPVAERHVVGAGRHNIRIADEPARAWPRAAIRVRLVVPVRHRDLPAAGARTIVLE